CASCGSSVPTASDPALLLEEEARLMRPFDVPRVVVADRLDVTMTGNFFTKGRDFRPWLAYPAGATRTTEEGGRTIYTWQKPSGGTPLEVRLGATTFALEQQVRITVLGGGAEVTLRAATNDALVEEASVRRRV